MWVWNVIGLLVLATLAPVVVPISPPPTNRYQVRWLSQSAGDAVRDLATLRPAAGRRLQIKARSSYGL